MNNFPNIDYHLILFVIAILYGIGVQLFRFLRFLGKQFKTTNTAVSPMQRAIADAQRQAQAAAQAPTRPRQPLTAQSPRSDPGFGRRPEAGGSPIPQPATDQQFRAQVRQLEADEEAPSPNIRRAATVSVPASDPPQVLFANTDDLVRAFILQEVLGRPRSRRNSGTS